MFKLKNLKNGNLAKYLLKINDRRGKKKGKIKRLLLRKTSKPETYNKLLMSRVLNQFCVGVFCFKPINSENLINGSQNEL